MPTAYYRSAPNMTFPRGRILRQRDDGRIELWTGAGWDSIPATHIPANATRIPTEDAVTETSARPVGRA